MIPSGSVSLIRTFDSGNTDITVDCLVETWFQFQLSADKVSPFVSPSAWPPPSDGWTGTCWSCRAESQHLDRNTTDRKWKHCTRPWRQRLLKILSQFAAEEKRLMRFVTSHPGWGATAASPGLRSLNTERRRAEPESLCRSGSQTCSVRSPGPDRAGLQEGETTRDTHGDCERHRKQTAARRQQTFTDLLYETVE